MEEPSWRLTRPGECRPLGCVCMREEEGTASSWNTDRSRSWRFHEHCRLTRQGLAVQNTCVSPRTGLGRPPWELALSGDGLSLHRTLSSEAARPRGWSWQVCVPLAAHLGPGLAPSSRLVSSLGTQ